jgi:hypothetical protein
MLPSYYTCTSCRERFTFSQHEARYLVDSTQMGGQVAGADLLTVPVRPGWCKNCSTVCLVEDIASVRDFEHAYGAVRAGRSVDYPISTDCLTLQQAQDEIGAYLRWRMTRRHPARALCCGGVSFQFLDVPLPLLKHADCEFGVIEPIIQITSFNGPGPGVYSAADIRVYDGEGELVGLMKWRNRETEMWDVVPAAYSEGAED